MSQQTINVGSAPNDGTGTPLRTAFQYTNSNFSELYTALGGGSGLPGATTQVIFNDGGTNLAGDAGLVYNKTTDALTIGGNVQAASGTVTGNLTVDTNVLVVDATNNRVGIGTASPVCRMELSVADAAEGARFSATSALLRFHPYLNATDKTRIQATNGTNTGLSDLTLEGFNLRFNTNGGLAATIDSSGNLGLGVTPSAGAGVLQLSSGINFPATQVASSNANTLDDYEEGTWTGTLKGATTDPTTAVTATGRYTKIGRQVTIDITFSSVNTTGAAGQISVAGAPLFTSNSSVGSTGSVMMSSIGSFTGVPVAFIGTSTTVIELYASNSAGALSFVNHNAGTTRSLWISLTYSV